MSQEIDWAAGLDSWPIPVAVTDYEGRLIYANQALTGLFAEQPDSLDDLLDKESSPARGLILQSGPPPAEPVRIAVKLTTGTKAELTGAGLPDRTGVMFEIRPTDRFEQSDTERLEGVIQMLRALGHDMCQPLTVILGQAEMMTLTQTQNEDVTRRLNQIIAEAEKLEGMTRKLSQIIHDRHK